MAIDRRVVLGLGAAALVAGVAAMLPRRPAVARGDCPFRLTDAEWRRRLTLRYCMNGVALVFRPA